MFHGLSGGRTGQPPTIGPLVTTKGALVEHERPRQARSRWRPWARRLRRLTWVLAWRAVATPAPVDRQRLRQPAGDVDDQRAVRAHADGRDADRGGRAGGGDEQRDGGGDGEQGGAHPAAG